MGVLTNFAREQGIEPEAQGGVNQDLASIVFGNSQPSEEQDGGFLKTAAGLAQGTFGAAGDLLFKTSVEAAGSVIGSGVESAARLIGKDIGTTFTEKAEELLGTPKKAAKTIAFTALELAPEIKAPFAIAKKFLSKIPKVEGLIDIAIRVLNKIPDNLRERAVKQYSQALGASTKGFKKLTAKVVPSLLNKRVTALTERGFLAKAEAARFAAGDALDDVLLTIPNGSKIKTESVIEALDAIKARATIAGTDVVADPRIVASIDEVKAVIERLGKDASFESLHSLRKIWDRAVAEGKGFIGKTLKEGSELSIKRSATNAIRAELARDFPDLAKVNAEFSLWSNVEDILAETIERKSTQAGGLGVKISTGAGTTLGAVTGGFQGAVVVGVLANQLNKLFKSVGWKTISAVKKNQLADALVDGNLEKVGLFIKEMLASAQNLGRSLGEDQSLEL